MTTAVLPGGWTRARIGDVASVSRGASPRPIALARWFSRTSEVGWVRIADVTRSDGLTLLSTTQRLSEEGIARSRLLRPGTLIMSIAATVGLPIVTGIPSCIHDGFVALERLRDVNQRYLFYVLKSLEGELRAAGQTGSQQNLNSEIVRGLVIDLPPEPEQLRIADVLSGADLLIIKLERLIAKKQAIKQGMMQQLLTGKTRLPGFEGNWSRRTLGRLGIFLKGRGVKRDDVQPSGVPCIRYGELYTKFRDYTPSTVTFVSPTVADTALPIQSGDLLFAGSGETREDIGVCVAYTGGPAVAGGDIVVLRGSSFNPVFLALLCNTPAVANQKARLGQGDAVVHISSRALSSIEANLPPRDEQDAIAGVVTDADAEIRALDLRLRKAKAVKQGMMQELLTGRTRLPVKVSAA